LADDHAETITPFYQAAPELPTEPARQLDTRVTAVLEREPASRYAVSADDLDDPAYQRWRQQRQQSDTTIAQRMIDRERR